jgi:hypothetical protein
MSDKLKLRSKADVLVVLRHAGVDEHTIEALDAVLEDPVDLDRDAELLARYGITRTRVVDLMGGSP